MIDLEASEAAEELWREHNPPRTIAGSLLRAWSAAVFEFDGRNAIVAREYMTALEAAEMGKLTPAHVASLAKYVRIVPMVRHWIVILRSHLEPMVTVKAPGARTEPRPMPWAGGYVGYLRKPQESAEAFVGHLLTVFVGVSDAEAAEAMGVPVETVRSVREEWKR